MQPTLIEIAVIASPEVYRTDTASDAHLIHAHAIFVASNSLRFAILLEFVITYPRFRITVSRTPGDVINMYLMR